jgi:hypothetical protein
MGEGSGELHTMMQSCKSFEDKRNACDVEGSFDLQRVGENTPDSSFLRFFPEPPFGVTKLMGLLLRSA